MSDPMGIADMVRHIAAKQGVDVPTPTLRRPDFPIEVDRDGRRVSTMQAALATIPEGYAGARFGALRGLDARAVKAAQAALEQPTVTLFGPAGAGKTPLAVAMFAARLAAASWPSGLFVQAVTLLSTVHATGAGPRSQLFERAATTRLLVLDDVHAVPSYDGVQGWMRQLLEERTSNPALATIVTTELGAEQLASRFQDGLVKRLFRGAALEVRRAR